MRPSRSLKRASRQGASPSSAAAVAPIFETASLVARRLQPDDLAHLFAVYGDAASMRWVGDGEPITHEACVKWLEVTANNYRVRGYGMFALLDREAGDVVGFCGLVHPGGQVDAELKYALKRAYWGAGLATQAASAMLAYGAREHGLTTVIATAAPANTASHRVLLKAGMQRAERRDNEDGTFTQVFRWRAGTAENVS